MPDSRSIDAHCHWVTPECLENMSRVDSSWTFVREETAPESFHIQINDRRIGPMSLGGFNLKRRLADMDETEVNFHVLAPVPYLFLYEAKAETGEEFARLQNDCIAEIISDRPDRFTGIGTIPLQDPERAIRELERVIGTLGLRGIEIGTHVLGKNYDTPELFPVFERVSQLGAFILIHPYQVAAAERLRDYNFINSLGNPIDNSIAGASMAFGGIFEKFPDLKVMIVHGGGFIPYQHGRLKRMIEVRPKSGEQLKQPIHESLRKIHFDTLVFDKMALEFLVKSWGASHILMGTDYPFLMSDSDPVKTVKGLSGFSKEEITMIRGGNASRLLGLIF